MRLTKKRLNLAAALTAIALTPASAQLFQGRFVTAGYAWQRQDTVGQSSLHLYGYESVQLTFAGPSASFHTYFQGFNDFAGPVKNDPQFRLYNFAVALTPLGDFLTLNLGRQTVFAGVGTGTIDGGLVQAKFLENKIQVKGYLGSLPPAGQRVGLIANVQQNFLGGAQVIAAPLDFLRLSASFSQKQIKPDSYFATRKDSLFNPYQVEIKPTSAAEEYAGADVTIAYEQLVDAYVRYDYDLYAEKSSRYQFFGRFRPAEDIGVTAEYVQRDPRLMFNSIFSAFAYNTLKDYEVGAEYQFRKGCWAFGRFGGVSYGEGDNSRRVTVGMNGKYASVSVTQNVEESSKISAASIFAGYPLPQYKLTPTLMVSYAQYKLSGSTRDLDGALSIGLGAVYRPIMALSLDTQAQFVQNKIYSNDVRLFVRLSYYVTERFDIF